jgi:hypothetical protein
MAEHSVQDPGAEIRKKSAEEYAQRTKGKPTPTQSENDRAALGEHIHEHEDDGSGPDPFVRQPGSEHQENRHLEADKRPASYQTRTATPHRATHES